MGNTNKISRDNAIEGIDELRVAHAELLEEWKQFHEDAPKRMNAALRERRAYLHGKIDGVFSAIRKFEGKSPIEFQETD